MIITMIKVEIVKTTQLWFC